jgi:TonB family protein
VSERVLPWALLASIATHVVGLGAMTALDTASAPSSPVTIPVEIVALTPPSPSPPPATPAPKILEPLTPPRLVEQRPLRVDPSPAFASQPLAPYPLMAKERLLRPPVPRPGLIAEELSPSPRPTVVAPRGLESFGVAAQTGAVATPRADTGNLLRPPVPRLGLIGGFQQPTPRIAVGGGVASLAGAPRGADGGSTASAPVGAVGGLLPVPPGGMADVGAGTAGTGRGGEGGPSRGSAPGLTGRSGGPRAAGDPSMAGSGSGDGALGESRGAGDGLRRAMAGGEGDTGSRGGPATGDGRVTSFARPLGGYQTKPRYPDSALRAGIQGVTRLRFEVLTTGEVGHVLVEESAGSADLDHAAIEAVRTWRFEPARRGDQPVTVWVTLPVRFELRNSTP